MKIDGIELRRIAMPLVSPFRTSFGTETERDVLLVRVVTPQAEGWGECVAMSEPRYSSEYVDGAADVLRRVVITAPIAGTVVQLKAHTVGGVVGSGQPILDIVPRDEDLLIDARIAPTDIDVVREGLPAQVVLSAYKQRNLPRLEGRVRSVSADRIVDEKTSTPYYLVRIEVDREHLAKVAPDVELTPGMPAEAMVMTGHRTALSYLTQPFLDSLRRSMRES